jgi:hypothetical protein
MSHVLAGQLGQARSLGPAPLISFGCSRSCAPLGLCISPPCYPTQSSQALAQLGVGIVWTQCHTDAAGGMLSDALNYLYARGIDDKLPFNVNFVV